MDDFFKCDAFRVYRKKLIETVVTYAVPLMYSDNMPGEMRGVLDISKKIISIPIDNVSENAADEIRLEVAKDMEDLKISMIQKRIMKD
jgi:hypothetical protein